MVIKLDQVVIVGTLSVLNFCGRWSYDFRLFYNERELTLASIKLTLKTSFKQLTVRLFEMTPFIVK